MCELSNIHDYQCSPKTREIYLSEITSGEEISYTNTTKFIQNINYLDNNIDPQIYNKFNNNILVHMNIDGGEWHNGLAIYDTIKNIESTVTILGYGAISSISSIIFQAADNRIIMPHTEMMIHFGNMYEENTSTAYISGGKLEEKHIQIMLKIYAERCINGKYFQTRKNITLDKCVKFLRSKIKSKGDWWLTSQEILDYGLCDGIFGTPKFYKESIRIVPKKFASNIK